MAARYPHLHFRVWADPGLKISVRTPRGEGDFQTWHARLMGSLFPADVALEIVSQCLMELELPEGRLLALHMTD